LLAYSDATSGTYNLNGGLLSISSSGVSQGSGNGTLNLDGGTLEMNGGSITVGTFNAVSGVLRNVSGITVGGVPGLVKSPSVGGNNVLTLSGSNGYAGPTTLDAGMLVLASGSALSATSTGAVTLNGGTLSAGMANGMIAGPVYAGYGPHTIAPGAALPYGYYGNLSLNGGLTTNANTTLTFNMNQNYAIGTGTNGDSIYGGDLINLNGSPLTVNGGSIGFVSSPTTMGDYRLIANAGGNLNLGNFVLP
jgi:autotransporter-associated beta strand protein